MKRPTNGAICGVLLYREIWPLDRGTTDGSLTLYEQNLLTQGRICHLSTCGWSKESARMVVFLLSMLAICWLDKGCLVSGPAVAPIVVQMYEAKWGKWVHRRVSRHGVSMDGTSSKKKDPFLQHQLHFKKEVRKNVWVQVSDKGLSPWKPKNFVNLRLFVVHECVHESTVHMTKTKVRHVLSLSHIHIHKEVMKFVMALFLLFIGENL